MFTFAQVLQVLIATNELIGVGSFLFLGNMIWGIVMRCRRTPLIVNSVKSEKAPMIIFSSNCFVLEGGGINFACIPLPTVYANIGFYLLKKGKEINCIRPVWNPLEDLPSQVFFILYVGYSRIWMLICCFISWQKYLVCYSYHLSKPS